MIFISRAVPGLKQRIAGKSLPIEKFCAIKAERWKSRGYLVCAQYVRFYLVLLITIFQNWNFRTYIHQELIYLWNGFHMLNREPTLVAPILDDVTQILEEETGFFQI